MIWWSFITSKSAASSAEYALIIAMLLTPLLFGLDAFGQGLLTLFESLGGIFETAEEV